MWIPFLSSGMLIRLGGGQRTCVNAAVCDLVPLSASVRVHKYWCLTARLLEIGQCLKAKCIHASEILTYWMKSEFNLLTFYPSTKCAFTFARLEQGISYWAKACKRNLAKYGLLYWTPLWRDGRKCRQGMFLERLLSCLWFLTFQVFLDCLKTWHRK